MDTLSVSSLQGAVSAQEASQEVQAQDKPAAAGAAPSVPSPDKEAAAAAGHPEESAGSSASSEYDIALPPGVHAGGCSSMDRIQGNKLPCGWGNCAFVSATFMCCVLWKQGSLLRVMLRHAGETKRMCIICLESYIDGEKLRVLPCQHRFHM